MKIRTEGKLVILLSAGITFLVFLTSKNFLLFFLFLVITGFVLNFFRDPERFPESESETDILSPADGKVISVDERENYSVFSDLQISPYKVKRIAIFMSPLDVHVNRSPVSGKVVNIVQKKGGFERAFLEKSESNARAVWFIESDYGKFILSQIAGAVARRIKVFKQVGDSVKRGERIGIIYFGSRVDLYVEDRYQIKVKPGDKVYAGKTVVASLQKN